MNITQMIEVITGALTLQKGIEALGEPEDVNYGTNRRCMKFGGLAVKTSRDGRPDAKSKADNLNEYECFSLNQGSGVVPNVHFISDDYSILIVDYVEGEHVDPYDPNFDKVEFQVNLAVNKLSETIWLSDLDPRASYNNIKVLPNGEVMLIDLGSCIPKDPSVTVICKGCGQPVVYRSEFRKSEQMQGKVDYARVSSLYTCNCNGGEGLDLSNEEIVEAHMAHNQFGKREIGSLIFEDSSQMSYEPVDDPTQFEISSSIYDTVYEMLEARHFNVISDDANGTWIEANVHGENYYTYLHEASVIYKIVNGQYQAV